MIDTHCHLTDPRLSSQLQHVLDNAAAAGVSRMITIGTDLEDARAAVALCRQQPHVRCAIGIHPNHSHEAQPDHLAALRELCGDRSVVAVGETGLDYFRDHAARPRQLEFFTAQLALAVEIGRPVVIHCREAVDDALAVLRDFPAVRAVFHCFTGTFDEAMRIIDAGCLIGFTGPVTYRRNDELRRAVRAVPIDRMLLETDAPYLSPEPMRSQRVNEPALVMHTAQRIASERGISLDELDAITTRNALALFGQWPERAAQ